MEQFREKLRKLREDTDVAIARAEKAEAVNKEYAQRLLEEEQRNASDQRKIAVLEEALDAAEKNVKETTEKLRQVDVEAEHLERRLRATEQDRDQWAQKHDEMLGKYKASQAELDELMRGMEGL